MELMPNCVDNAIKNLTNEPAMSIGTLIKDAIYLNNSENDFYNKVPYTFDTYPNQHEARYVSFSLSSLMRLGILAFDDDALVHPADDSPFKNSDFYKQCEEERIKTGKYLHSEIVGKICGLTPFGTALIQACLD